MIRAYCEKGDERRKCFNGCRVLAGVGNPPWWTLTKSKFLHSPFLKRRCRRFEKSETPQGEFATPHTYVSIATIRKKSKIQSTYRCEITKSMSFFFYIYTIAKAKNESCTKNCADHYEEKQKQICPLMN
jgi:hypothetical protein